MIASDVREVFLALATAGFKDEGIRRKLVANPKHLIEEELGQPIPFRIKVVEDTQDLLNIVIPVNPRAQSPECFEGKSLSEIASVMLGRVSVGRNESAPDVDAELVALAWSDPVFLQNLRDDLKETIAKFLKVDELLPREVRLHEDTTDEIHLALPASCDEAPHLLSHAIMEINADIFAQGSGSCPGSVSIRG